MTSHAGYFVILNVAIGGAFPNALAGSTPTAATVPGRPMLVDYVAVWTQGAGGPTTPGPSTPAPTGPAGGTWAPGTASTVGSLVTYGGVTYQCRQAHTAQVGWEPPITLALWLPV